MYCAYRKAKTNEKIPQRDVLKEGEHACFGCFFVYIALRRRRREKTASVYRWSETSATA